MILRPYFGQAPKRWDQVTKVGSGLTFRYVLYIRLAIPAARIEALRSAKLPIFDALQLGAYVRMSELSLVIAGF